MCTGLGGRKVGDVIFGAWEDDKAVTRVCMRNSSINFWIM